MKKHYLLIVYCIFEILLIFNYISFFNTTSFTSLSGLLLGESNYEVNIMLNTLWNSIESSSHRNAIILTILLTSFVIILIFFMGVLLKSDKSNKRQ
jgi:hypothetical protein